mmetsp:Transcript_1477/g.1588  ORF Transcript_1477/g.1588 Transcript_1477/m.1588 type:complete len:386 (+) Transcript_1477:91-1248(+)
MARATTTTIALVLLLLHTAAASKYPSSWECAPVKFNNEPHHDIDAKLDTDANEVQYSSSQQPIHKPHRRQRTHTHEESSEPSLVGSGREFTLFDQRGGDEETIPASSTTTTSSPSGLGGASPPGDGTGNPYRSPFQNTGLRRRKRSSRYGSGYPTGGGSRYFSGSGGSSSAGSGGGKTSGSGRRGGTTGNGSGGSGNPLANLREWITTSGNLPKIQCRVEPNTTLKVRKTFRPLKTTVVLGADFNTQLGVWQFKSSWEDRIIGGKLTLAGREMQFCKTWLLSVGVVEDLVTRLRLRAAVDLGTMKAYARLGFRTERLSPINVVEGFTLTKKLPLDGNYGHVKLEVKANFAFPEPEIEYSTENHRSFVGMGDIEVNIDELNLLLNY